MLKKANGQIVFPPDSSEQAPKVLIENGRVIDPVNGIDGIKRVALSGGKIHAISDEIPEGFVAERTIDASGKWVVPGLMDIHVHLREPGREDRETIQTGTNAACAGGFTSVACMPNTSPVLDEESKIRYVVQRGESCPCRIYPIGSITKGLLGEELSPFGEMVRAGARGFSDDGKSVYNSKLMRNALNYVKSFNVPIISHCEDADLVAGAHMNESAVSTRLGLRGMPSVSEEIIVARDTMLAEYTGARVHIAHVSTAGSVRIVRDAKKRGVKVTCETCPHYFIFTDEALGNYDTHKKMNPPLRSEADRQAIIEGLADGTIDVIATDHAPHVSEDKKDVEFEAAAFGVIGLETSIGCVLTHLVHKDILSPTDMVQKMAVAPNRILETSGGSLSKGADADVTIVDPKAEWTVDPDAFYSKAENTAFAGHRLQGFAACTILGGKIVFERK